VGGCHWEGEKNVAFFGKKGTLWPSAVGGEKDVVGRKKVHGLSGQGMGFGLKEGGGEKKRIFSISLGKGGEGSHRAVMIPSWKGKVARGLNASKCKREGGPVSP